MGCLSECVCVCVYHGLSIALPAAEFSYLDIDSENSCSLGYTSGITEGLPVRGPARIASLLHLPAARLVDTAS